MKFCLRIVLLLFLLTGTLTQDFDLSDALDDTDPTPAKPKEQPKAPEKPKTDDPTPAKPKEQPKAPEKPKTDEFDLSFALDDTDPTPTPDKPAVKPPVSGGGGGSFDNNDLSDVLEGDYKPDGGRSGGGGAADPGQDTQDPDLLWGQILKMLNANIPEEFFMWISNLEQMFSRLLERAIDLLQAMA
ncbi:hypothetical protein PAMA_014194 [Pampus argenteus]